MFRTPSTHVLLRYWKTNNQFVKDALSITAAKSSTPDHGGKQQDPDPDEVREGEPEGTRLETPATATESPSAAAVLLVLARSIITLCVEDPKDRGSHGGCGGQTAPERGKVLRAPDDGDDGRVDGEESPVPGTDRDRGHPKCRRGGGVGEKGEAKGEQGRGEDEHHHACRDG